MTHEEYKQKYLGRSFDYDAVAGAQCADVAKSYVAEVHGKRWRAFGGYPNPNGGVINAFLNYPNCFIYPEDYDLIENNPNDINQIPKKGDIVIWGDYELTGPEGHIAIVDSASTQGFTSIDQNWNDGRGLQTKLVTHNYRGILGWLRVKDDYVLPDHGACVDFTLTSETPGVSYALKALGSPYYKDKWAWHTVGEANVYRPSDFDMWNASLKVGQTIKVPEKLLPSENKNDLDEFVGALKGKVDITHDEYLAIRKQEAALNDVNDRHQVEALEQDKKELIETIGVLNKQLDTQWNLQTFLVGMTKKFVNTGGPEALAGILAATIISYVPQLESVQNELLIVMTVLFGTVIGGKNVKEINKL